MSLVARLIPPAAVVAGAVALAPGLAAPAGPDLPPPPPVATAPTALAAADRSPVVAGDDWQVMSLVGSRRAPGLPAPKPAPKVQVSPKPAPTPARRR